MVSLSFPNFDLTTTKNTIKHHHFLIPCPIQFHNQASNPNPNFVCTMCSSNAFPSSLFAPSIHTPFLPLRPSGKVVSIFVSPNPGSARQLRFRKFSVNVWDSAVTARKDISDEYAGWDVVVESPAVKEKKGNSKIVIAGVGASVAAVLAAFLYFSSSRNGFRLPSVSTLRGGVNPSQTEETNGETVDSDANEVDLFNSEGSTENVPDVLKETQASVEKVERVIVSVAMDPTQQEALAVLKKLKVVEDDIKPDELCTRRKYAKWLVRANSLLERNPKYKFCSSQLLSGSITTAFDDIDVEDPDFDSIQALAEAGIILSKLSGKSSISGPDSAEGQGGVNFFPDRSISRHDLIDWKAQLDYKLTPLVEMKISQIKSPFIDVRELNADASPGFFIDVLAGEKSILRKVFGQIRRFQPNRPSTKAQAVVTLTSGRMTKAIEAELARIEAEHISRQIEMAEIKYELLEIGEIKKYWDQKLKEERTRSFDIEKAYQSVLHDLAQVKNDQGKRLAMLAKEKAAMDCQRQLILSLDKEMSEMSSRLENETNSYLAEQRHVKDMLIDVQIKYEALLDAKSILEAEKEAGQILRSWVEDEARKSQARAKVLQAVTQRWSWGSED